MHIFVTGATGFLGTAVIGELLSHGHTVLALNRSPAGIIKLDRPGVTTHPGNLEDLESLQSGAAQTDATIHTGFIHDWNRYPEACQIDAKAITAIGQILKGTNKPFAISSAAELVQVRPGHPAIETDPCAAHHSRTAGHNAFLDLTTQGVRTIIVRLPPSIHGKGDHAFVPMLIDNAKSKGSSTYLDGGLNRWSSVHRNDAASLFRLIVEQSDNIRPGTVYHAVSDAGTPFKDLATLIGNKLNIPVIDAPTEQGANQLGSMARFAGIDYWTSSEITRKSLGWTPKEAGWLDDIEANYF